MGIFAYIRSFFGGRADCGGCVVRPKRRRRANPKYQPRSKVFGLAVGRALDRVLDDIPHGGAIDFDAVTDRVKHLNPALGVVGDHVLTESIRSILRIRANRKKATRSGKTFVVRVGRNMFRVEGA